MAERKSVFIQASFLHEALLLDHVSLCCLHWFTVLAWVYWRHPRSLQSNDKDQERKVTLLLFYI